MNKGFLDSLRERYPEIHPLIFQRSVEHAESEVALFNLLESMPKKYPVSWDENEKCWKRISDISFQKKFLEETK